jgi:CBS domain-containing protein
MKVKEIMTRAVATCQPFDKLLDAASIVQREDVGCLPVVTDDGSERVLGMLTDRDVAVAAGHERSSLAEMYVRNAMTGAVLSRAVNDSLEDALADMRTTGARRLPVVDRDGRLLGLLTLSDITLLVASGDETVAASSRAEICRILAASTNARKSSRGLVGNSAIVDEIMEVDIVACRSDETLGAVARRMDRTRVPCTPVLEAGSGRRVVAMLTDRDICMAAASRARPLDELSVGLAMSPVLRSCWPDDSLDAVAAIMRAYGVRRLPVVDSSFQLLGLVALGDLARSSLSNEILLEDIPACDEIVETLAAIIRVAGDRPARVSRSRGDLPRSVER